MIGTIGNPVFADLQRAGLQNAIDQLAWCFSALLQVVGLFAFLFLGGGFLLTLGA